MYLCVSQRISDGFTMKTNSPLAIHVNLTINMFNRSMKKAGL